MNLKPYQEKPDPDHRFFLYDAETGRFRYFESAADRDAGATDLIFRYSEDGPWIDTVGDIVAGEVTDVCVRRGVREADPVEQEESPEIAFYCMYELRRVGAVDEPEPPRRAGINRDHEGQR